MKIRIAFLLLICLFLFGCSGQQNGISEEFMIDTPEKEDLNTEISEQISEKTKNAYYRMTCTTSPIDVTRIMYILLPNDDEQKAFDTAETETSLQENGSTLQEGMMTVDGITYRWAECEGIFVYGDDRLVTSISVENAEKMARDFLDQLGWEYSENLETQPQEDGSVNISCRFCYEDVKLMGRHEFFFEPGNEEEIPTRGSYITLSLSETGIFSVDIASLLQPAEILQTYDAKKDFLSLEEVENVVKKYLEISTAETPDSIAEADLEGISVEIIYMPYQDSANGNVDILLPAFEVRLPYYLEGMPDGTMVLYIDATTGYVYGEDIEFF